MSREATPIILTDEERDTLQAWVRATKTEHRLMLRARIVLAADAGEATTAIAAKLSVTPVTVSKWRLRFARDRLLGLQDALRPGKPPRYTLETERRVLRQLDQPPPPGYAQWTGPLLAAALGEVSEPYVWRVLRKHHISLQSEKTWCESSDPEFGAKAADIIGLYLAPPDNAVVVCVDEKPGIQALERRQGWLRLPNGKAITGRNHEYKRHGTTNLFAALQVATGQVQAGHSRRKRRREFLEFMNELVAEYPPEAEIHVILDNYCTHKPRHDRWLQRHKNVHLHFTPTQASWLNQVETWFSILWRQSLRGASFQSPRELRRAIDDFIATYNENAEPFEWRKTVVYPKRLKASYADLCK
jgi:transposase